MFSRIQSLFTSDTAKNKVEFGQRQVVFDCETDGLDPVKNKILSIGAVEIINGRIQLETAWELRIARPNFDGGGAHVHELTQRELSNGVTELEAVKQFTAFAGQDLLVGHFIEFDFAIVNGALKNQGLNKLENQTFDTLTAMRQKFPEGLVRGRKSWPLERCCEKYHIPSHGAHTALGDAHMTAMLFLALRSK